MSRLVFVDIETTGLQPWHHEPWEIAVIERMANGAIPSAAVRTEAGRARTVRTVDLEPAN